MATQDQLPATMRAVVMERRGPAREALVLRSDHPLPQRKPNEVLVAAAATAIGAGDWKMRSGFAPIPLKLPKILGEDLAGLVVEAPEGSKFKRGDRVFAGTGQVLKSGERFGTNAEFVAADEATLCHIPPGISFQEAAAVPVSGLTAWQALEPAMPLEGKRLLVHGGAGGVGSFAVQIAKVLGAGHVATTCSSRNVEWVMRELGADAAIDYTQGPWEASPAATAEPFDHVVDTMGGSYEPASLALLRRGGSFAGLGASGPGVERVSLWGIAAMLLNALRRWAAGRLRLGPRYTFVMQQSKASRGLEQLAALMAEGKVKAHVDRVYPLEELAAAHEYAEQGHVRGKVGIAICDDPAARWLGAPAAEAQPAAA